MTMLERTTKFAEVVGIELGNKEVIDPFFFFRARGSAGGGDDKMKG